MTKKEKKNTKMQANARRRNEEGSETQKNDLLRAPYCK